jgi:hypothetical protein
MSILERSDNKIAGFVFKGQMAEVAVEQCLTLPKQGGELSFDEISLRVGIKELSEDEVAEARKMAAVYIAIASFENMVRDLISTRMLEVKKENWWKDYVSAEIQRKAQRKIDDESFFTELADLVPIIRQNWTVFEDIIQDIDWLQQIIKSIERSRNVIMHSGQLSLDDIERVGVNIRDYVRQVGA